MQCPSFQVSDYGMFNSKIKFPKNTATLERHLDCYEIEYYNQGCPGTAYIDGVSYSLSAGTIICGKPNQLRRSRLPYKCFYIHIQTDDPDLIALLQHIPDCFVSGRIQELTQIFSEIQAVEKIDTVENRLLLQSNVCRLLWKIAQLQSLNPDPQQYFTVTHQELLLDAEKYIKEHLQEDLSLSVLSAYCNLSPAYFHRLFTAFFDQSPAQYVLNCRIAAAKISLVTSEKSLSFIAADCGFSSQAYFCYKFKQVTGSTPLQYRKGTLCSIKL